MLTSKDVTAEEKPRVWAYIPLFLAAIIFWSLQEQGSSILALFASERTQSTLFGVTIQASWYQSLNPIFIFILTPVFVTMWTKLGERQPSTVVKFSWTFICRIIVLAIDVAGYALWYKWK